MSIKAIECPDGVCHSHHGGHAVPRQAMQKNLEKHGKDWCEKLAERIMKCQLILIRRQSCPVFTHQVGKEGI